MVGIKLENLTKKFGDTTAVKDLNLEIEDGEFVVLLGPSGCGKTTTLRMIAGLESPTRGTIKFGEKEVNDLSPQERDIAMVFQSYALFPHMTVFDNIASPLKIQKKPSDLIQKKVREVSEMLEIPELLEQKPPQLSGGQQQRVALGRAIIRDPEVFLLDEPLANLDERLRLEMRRELKKLHEKLGTPTLYVTHDQREAMTMGDRVVVLKEGILQQLGDPDYLYQNPDNLFIANFLGDPPINILDGRILRKNEKPRVDVGIDKFTIDSSLLPDASEVKVCIRPEDVTINKTSEETSFKAEVSRVESHGKEKQVELIADGELIRAISDPHLNLKQGDKVFVEFDKKDVSIYEKRKNKVKSKVITHGVK